MRQQTEKNKKFDFNANGKKRSYVQLIILFIYLFVIIIIRLGSGKLSAFILRKIIIPILQHISKINCNHPYGHGHPQNVSGWIGITYSRFIVNPIKF